MLESKMILSLRFIVERSFLTRQPAYCERMRELFGDGSIRTCRTHAKFMTVKNSKWNCAIRTSMNLNENPRLENIEISDDPALCGFLCAVVDELFCENAEGDFSSGVPGPDPGEPFLNVNHPGDRDRAERILRTRAEDAE